jgi:lipopolysaccharide export system permease protein
MKKGVLAILKLTMAIPLIWRYLLKQYISVFLFCTLAFVTLLLTMRLGDIAHFATLGVDLTTLGWFVAYQIPYILPIAIPVSSLISAIIMAGRLCSSHELLAFRAQGASLAQLFTPIFLTALFLALFNFYIVSEVATKSHFETAVLKGKTLAVNPLLMLHNKHLMRLKGGIFEPLGSSKLGKSAKDGVIAFPDQKTGRMRYLFAKKLENQTNSFQIRDLSIASGLQGNGILIENTHKIQADPENFSSLFEKKVHHVANDHLPLSALVAKKNFFF